jgi:hypothetical protein
MVLAACGGHIVGCVCFVWAAKCFFFAKKGGHGGSQLFVLEAVEDSSWRDNQTVKARLDMDTFHLTSFTFEFVMYFLALCIALASSIAVDYLQGRCFSLGNLAPPAFALHGSAAFWHMFHSVIWGEGMRIVWTAPPEPALTTICVAQGGGGSDGNAFLCGCNLCKQQCVDVDENSVFEVAFVLGMTCCAVLYC